MKNFNIKNISKQNIQNAFIGKQSPIANNQAIQNEQIIAEYNYENYMKS